ncbi:hybrid sensor histidine kinase/response regulator [Myxococcus xanthus]|uniref:histidine kinase n=1 Tax=Myxococcus xanthus TaxID=34 RepID=A0AAE6FZB8_MYXXA|nr:ATP-binding protein [Myxococcus xanthus]QDE67890.1 hybrid sensor histidine kinase/response regulator [Myxococcus xanthus]QDE75167.1 hybrid sensor histidine kinase/response regulator [Myxococcus xanthus]
MFVTLVALPPEVSEEVERGILESDAGRNCQILRVPLAGTLPEAISEGLIVLWDDGGPLSELCTSCQRLNALRGVPRTHLVVLTGRVPEEADALAAAGADECLPAPGTHWGVRLSSLRRRQSALSDGDATPTPGLHAASDRAQLESQWVLADRMASIGTLAAGVAHEINNPLSYVSSNLSYLRELLAQPELSHEQLMELREVVAEAQEGAGRVSAIVRDLRTFSRADEELHGPVDMVHVVDGALRLLRNQIGLVARLTCTLEPVLPVHGNEARLTQIVVNLLLNALQALPDRAPEENRVRVSLRASSSRHVELEVSDNGHGMAPDVQRRIFDPFFSTRPVGEGTGLGLSISLTLVQAMGGRIEVSSAPGWGSTFRIVLPTQAAGWTDGVEPAQALEPAPARLRRRLLLIDDEPSVGNSVSRLVRDVYEIHVVQDAREALRLLSMGERFDAILCDVMMPGMSGLDFVVELERLAPDLALRTGLMTGGAFTAQAREFVGRRTRGLLEKPFERERLCTFVEHLFQ